MKKYFLLFLLLLFFSCVTIRVQRYPLPESVPGVEPEIKEELEQEIIVKFFNKNNNFYIS